MSLFTLQQKIEKIILLQSMEILCDIEIGKAAFQSLPLQLRANQSLGKVGRVLYAEEIAEELQICNAAVLVGSEMCIRDSPYSCVPRFFRSPQSGGSFLRCRREKSRNSIPTYHSVPF